MTSTWEAFGHFINALWPSARRATRLAWAFLYVLGAMWVPAFFAGLMGWIPLWAAIAFAPCCLHASFVETFRPWPPNLPADKPFHPFLVGFVITFFVAGATHVMRNIGYGHFGDLLALLLLGGLSVFELVMPLQGILLRQDMKACASKWSEAFRFTDEQERMWERGVLALSSRRGARVGSKPRGPRL